MKRGAKMYKIAFDVMGGDNGVQEAISGAKMFLKEYKDVELHLFGDENEIKKHISEGENVKIFHCSDVITMEDKAMAFRSKPESSMVRAIKAVKDGLADAVLSSGSTGTYLTASYLMLRTLEGIDRPGLAVPFPTVIKGKYKVVMDVGANVENTAEHLHQYALMGAIYSKTMFGIDKPRVSLLSNGTEEGKGSPLTLAAYDLIKADSRINFVGNTEPKTIMEDDCDVLVCDGFSGNVLMKTLEGGFKGMGKVIKQEITRGPIKTLGALLIKGGMNTTKKRLSPEEVGGSIMLGLNNVAVKAQGASQAAGYFGGLRQTYNLLNGHLLEKVKQEVK